jgi:hypothetical protein
MRSATDELRTIDGDTARRKVTGVLGRVDTAGTAGATSVGPAWPTIEIRA